MEIGNIKFSESLKTIIPLMIEAQKEIPPFTKDATNPHSSSKYITLDSILETILPIFNDKDIFVSQPGYEEKDDDFYGVGVATLFMHKDGEYIYYPPVYFQFEKGGRMNLTQSTGSLITYARRYMLTTILGLRTGEDADGLSNNQNNNQHNNAPNQYNNAPKQQNNNEFKNNLNELFERTTNLAKESNQDFNKIYENLLKRANKANNTNYTEITENNLQHYNIELTRAEASFKKNKTKQAQANKSNEQTSLMQGNTTNAVNWGQ